MSSEKKQKWLIYSVLLGAAPVMLKSSMYYLMTPKMEALLLDRPDILFFCAILAVMNILEIEHSHNSEKWRINSVGISFFIIILCIFLYPFAVLEQNGLNNIFNQKVLRGCCYSLAIISFVLSLTIYLQLRYMQTDNKLIH